MLTTLFTVMINDDTTLENDETFKLSIMPNSLSDQVTVGGHSEVTVTIVDNDGKLLLQHL